MKALENQLNERYTLTENQMKLLRPGLKFLATQGVESIDHPRCRPIIEYCEKWAMRF